MLKRALAAALFMLAVATPVFGQDGGRYGKVEVVAPSSPARGLVILFSDAQGPGPRDKARLEAIANAGAIAVSVDSRTYLDNLRRADPGCLILFRDAEQLSRQLQREHPTPEYRVPIVAGEGLGGELASRVVIQSQLQTVGGGIAVDPAASLPLERDICPRPLEADDRQGPGTPDAPVLKNPWIVALTPSYPADARAHLTELAAHTRLMSLHDLPNAGDALAFADLVRPLLSPEHSRTVDALPLVEMRAAHPTRRMAVFISGDGGWRDVDKRVSEKLQTLGVSVVGIDSLRYFWSPKTPDQVAADVAAVIEAYEKKWNCDQVALIGFSLGADVLPFVYNRLDPSLRDHIAMMTILSPGPAADWVIRVVGWFGSGPSDAATPVGPAVATLPGKIVQCFFGRDDKGRGCGLYAARGAEVFSKSGDHHMDHDYDLIGRQIADGFSERTKGSE
jgi:type IV secretory pathway VirJ component